MAELPLVLLHAFPVDSRMWNGVRATLAARTRLITPDQRGLGRSPMPETDREPSLDDAAADVVALLDKLELEQVVLGGCSMGGYLTMAVQRLAPERVGGLVFVDTKATADAPAAAVNRHAVADRAEQTGSVAWLAPSMVSKLVSKGTLYRRQNLVDDLRGWISSQPPVGIAWAQRAMAARPDSTDALREADVPALVLVGTEDTLTPPAEARALVAALPKSELVELPRAGHLSPLDDPAGVAEAIVRW